MSTSKVTYLGDLRTQCEHLRSGNTYITDAPLDNQGKGAAFSPTDTVATDTLTYSRLENLADRRDQHLLSGCHTASPVYHATIR